MKNIIEAFTAVLFIILFAFAGISVITVSSSIMAAKEYKADVIAEIENSDFNENVINTCVSQGADAGYQVEVTPCTYDENNNMRTAEVVVSYEYKLPLFGISGTKSTRGIAR